MSASGVLLLLTSGLVLGRMWQWLKDKIKSGANQCPRCAITDEQRQTLLEISAIRRHGEEQMRRATSQAQHPRHHGTDESVWWPGQR